MQQGAIDAADWEQEAWKTVIATGGSRKGPYDADLQIGITSTGRIAGRRQSGTSGVQFAVGGFVDGLDVTIWIIKDQPPGEAAELPYFGEYSGQFSSPDMNAVEGTWVDVQGNEGTFTMNRVVA